MNKYEIEINEIHTNKRKEDLLMGVLGEVYILDAIKSKFGDIEKLDEFHPMDFYSKQTNTYFEIKSRRNTYNKYPTTMVGYNKIDWIHKNNIENVYFIFVFTDGDYYYKFDEGDSFMKEYMGRYDRGKKEYKEYLMIPITKLTKF